MDGAPRMSRRGLPRLARASSDSQHLCPKNQVAAGGTIRKPPVCLPEFPVSILSPLVTYVTIKNKLKPKRQSKHFSKKINNTNTKQLATDIMFVHRTKIPLSLEVDASMGTKRIDRYILECLSQHITSACIQFSLYSFVPRGENCIFPLF